MNLIRKFVIGSTLVGSSLSIGSCSDHTHKCEERFSNFMADRPHSEVVEIENKLRGTYHRGVITNTDRQLYMDSVAYRSIFEATQKANDSTAVADFNKIAASMQADIERAPSMRGVYYTIDYNSLEEKLSKMVLTKEYNKIINEADNTIALQYKVDSVAYRRFFEKHNLLNDSVAKKLVAVAKKIRP